MRKLACFLVIFFACSSGMAGDHNSKPVLSFSLTAKNGAYSHKFSSGLVLSADRDELGWVVEVHKRGTTDNLLYPRGNWHGAQPCHISAWSHRSQTFPDERVIPVRGFKASVRIRLIDATVTGAAGEEKFTGGRLEVYWEQPAVGGS